MKFILKKNKKEISSEARTVLFAGAGSLFIIPIFLLLGYLVEEIGAMGFLTSISLPAAIISIYLGLKTLKNTNQNKQSTRVIKLGIVMSIVTITLIIASILLVIIMFTSFRN